eukprot:TRINITY_DN64956_c0_g1_i1.p1 TRINITY_DN64956_c0_g1~~TRINITY_DN64956_c0_g1_i1.p1  ORF type:complete len:430 (-),score=61.77 TRINITY_DN64956_c0_g1_i1:58-1347(-)
MLAMLDCCLGDRAWVRLDTPVASGRNAFWRRRGISLCPAAAVGVICMCTYFFDFWDPCAHLLPQGSRSSASWQRAGDLVSPQLRFRADGTFRILQITDLHIRCFPDTGASTLATIAALIDAEHPDLVAFTGDICEGSGVSCRGSQRNQANIMRAAFSAAEDRGIPWAFVFGNWDRKPEAALTGSEVNDFLLSNFEHTLNRLPPPGVRGDSVFDVPVLPPSETAGTRPWSVLYFLDTHANDGCMDAPGVGCVYADEVAWFRQAAEAHRATNGGQPVPGLTFTHIPLPEYVAAWNRASELRGHLDEPSAAQGAGVSCVMNSSGLFAAMVDAGQMLGVTCGHDHDNDFAASLDGVRLMYGRKTGYGSYGPPSSWGALPDHNGARVIELRRDGNGEVHLSSWVRLMDGTRQQDDPCIDCQVGHAHQTHCNHAS